MNVRGLVSWAKNTGCRIRRTRWWLAVRCSALTSVERPVRHAKRGRGFRSFRDGSDRPHLRGTEPVLQWRATHSGTRQVLNDTPPDDGAVVERRWSR